MRKLTEHHLRRIVKKIINEQTKNNLQESTRSRSNLIHDLESLQIGEELSLETFGGGDYEPGELVITRVEDDDSDGRYDDLAAAFVITVVNSGPDEEEQDEWYEELDEEYNNLTKSDAIKTADKLGNFSTHKELMQDFIQSVESLEIYDALEYSVEDVRYGPCRLIIVRRNDIKYDVHFTNVSFGEDEDEDKSTTTMTEEEEKSDPMTSYEVANAVGEFAY